MPKVEVTDLVKLFGKRIDDALRVIDQGGDKDEVKSKTGCTLGIDRASLSVEEGELFVVMGLSGSGKSTLIRCLNRLIPPTRGSVRIDGTEVTDMPVAELRELRRSKLSMVFQQFALFPHRTVQENVEYGLKMQGMPPNERAPKAREAIDLVGLSDWGSHYPGQLSGGMQQRVGLARALATEPDVLLMDEAFSALDPLIRVEMQDELLRIQERMRKTIVFITHDLDEALKLGDRVAIMKDGRIVQIGAPEEILARPADDYVRAFVQDVNRARVFTAQHIMRRPDTLVNIKNGPRTALRKMEEKGLSSVFVVGRQEKLIGLVHADDAVAAVKRREETLEPIVSQDFPRAKPDTTVDELVPMAIEAKAPIAITDDEDHLLGIVVRVSVLSGIAGELQDELTPSEAVQEGEVETPSGPEPPPPDDLPAPRQPFQSGPAEGGTTE